MAGAEMRAMDERSLGCLFGSRLEAEIALMIRATSCPRLHRLKLIDRADGKTDVKVRQLVKTLAGDVLSNQDV
jgi:hypothetical protein